MDDQENLFSYFKARFHDAARKLQQEGVLPADSPIDRLSIEPPRDAAHGDVSSNAAMILAKSAGLKPMALAESFKSKLADDTYVVSVDIAVPGFINLTLKPEFWPKILKSVLEKGDAFGLSSAGQGDK